MNQSSKKLSYALGKINLVGKTPKIAQKTRDFGHFVDIQ
jgi:hypothetical protein